MSTAKERYVVLRKFLSEREQEELVAEALDAHEGNGGASPASVSKSKKSLRMELGIQTGESLQQVLPRATVLIRQAFGRASETFSMVHKLAQESTALTGLVLLYGPDGVMKSHYDSPTQPGQKEEWLAMLSIGSPVLFRCNECVLRIESGDALVMDSMSVLHGVEGIVSNIDGPRVGLPMSGSRLGILMWQARSEEHERKSEQTVEGIDSLFEQVEEDD